MWNKICCFALYYAANRDESVVFFRQCLVKGRVDRAGGDDNGKEGIKQQTVVKPGARVYAEERCNGCDSKAEGKPVGQVSHGRDPQV